MFSHIIKLRQSIGGIFRGQNYSTSYILTPELEKAFNDQINTEFFASFSYLSMAMHFGRHDVSCPGCQKYFQEQSQDEREHAEKIISYLLKRGSGITLKAIQPPANQCWASPLEAFKDAIRLEKEVTRKLLALRKLSNDVGDVFSCLFLENEMLCTQLEEYDKLSRHMNQLQSIGTDGSGIYLFDRYLLKETK